MVPLIPANELAWLARMVVGVTFLISGTAKLRDMDGLTLGALRYHVLPSRIVRPLAPLLPVAELVLAAMLLTGVAVRAAGVGSALLVLVFAWAVVTNLRRGRSIPCHCFGASAHERIGAATLARLAVLGIAAVLAAIIGPASGTLLPPGTETGLALLSAVASVTVLMALLGPGDIVVRDVGAARQAARWRREAEEEMRQTRERLLKRRRERRALRARANRRPMDGLALAASGAEADRAEPDGHR